MNHGLVNSAFHVWKFSFDTYAQHFSAGNSVVVYKMGNFVEISRGPMISNTGHLGKVSIVGVHPIQTEEGQLFRIQGVALPKGIMVGICIRVMAKILMLYVCLCDVLVSVTTYI